MRNISEGTGAILVREKYVDERKNREFIEYLKNEGFERWTKGKYYPDVDWIFVNINSKCYAFGMPGIKITTPLGEHAVTIEEFKVIYEIYRKYEGKAVLFYDEST